MSRFQSVFHKQLPGMRVYNVTYVPLVLPRMCVCLCVCLCADGVSRCPHSGNHDIGLGPSCSPAAYARYRQSFGPVNYDVTIANFSFVVMSSSALVSEKRCPREYHAAWHIVNDIEQRCVWHALTRGVRRTTKFTAFVLLRLSHPTADVASPDMEATAAYETDEHASPEVELWPRVLLTHIPLHRPDHAACGPIRGRRNMVQVGMRQRCFLASQCLIRALLYRATEFRIATCCQRRRPST